MGWAGEWVNSKCELCHQDKTCLITYAAAGLIEMFTGEHRGYIHLCNECVSQFIKSIVEVRKSV